MKALPLIICFFFGGGSGFRCEGGVVNNQGVGALYEGKGWMKYTPLVNCVSYENLDVTEDKQNFLNNAYPK